MNKRQVIILWAVALALGGTVTAVKLSQNTANRSATKRSSRQTLFETFPAAEVSTVEIQGAANLVTLTKKDGKWVTVERDNYPANSIYVNDLIRTMSELKVTIGMEAGPSFAPRFGMDASATKPEDHGLTATFKDAAGKEIAKVSLGKNIENSSSPAPMMGMGGGVVGRYIRNHADESGFYAVTEMFPSVSDETKRWLADGFISPEKIKSISLSKIGKSDADWTLTRETEEAEFTLQGASATEIANAAVTTPLKTLLSYARFDDVVPANKVVERTAEGKRTATVKTFEGFHYTLQITPTKPNAKPPALPSPGAEPLATDNFLVTVDLSAELPTERKKGEAEKPEETKTKDAAFADRLKFLNEKLVKEKALTGITFEVAKTTVEPLLKDRATLTSMEKSAPVGQSNNSGAQTPMSGSSPQNEAVTPALSAPDEEGGEDQ
jgi:Domain of unknown function (DUF4340)